MKFYKIDYLLNKIEGVNGLKCKKLLQDNKERFYKSPGSLTRHQNWKGGYIHHLEEIMSMAVNFYGLMFRERKADFTLSDALFVLFLHDLEKPFKYVEPKIKIGDDEYSEKDFVNFLLKKEGIKLSKMQQNGLKYIYGEGKDYHPKKCIQNPLGAFCHMCDNNSARIWYAYPKRK